MYNDEYLKGLYLQIELCDLALQNPNLLKPGQFETFTKHKEKVLELIEKRKAVLKIEIEHPTIGDR